MNIVLVPCLALCRELKIGLSLSGIGLLLIFGCANPAPIPGGPEDKTPPAVVEEKSTPNYQTNFSKETIRLTFDEWVQLRNVLGQVIVSPPLNYQPEIALKGKTVTFTFDKEEVLRDNATYTINFGDAIQDYTANNPAENLRFVFSTGNYIDSLSVNGVITDAATLKPVEGVLVMLYDQLADSVVYKEKPFYFGKTDQNGKFRMENIRSDTFKVFALEDANLNYLFDQTLERIAFQDTFLVLNDSLSPVIQLKISQTIQEPKIMNRETESPGRLSLVFNKIPDDFEGKLIGDSLRIVFSEAASDSLIIWYEGQKKRKAKLELNYRGVPFDTLTFSPRVNTADVPLRQKLTTRPGFHPDSPYEIHFNRLVESVDSGNVELIKDSTSIRTGWIISLDTINPQIIRINYPWEEETLYTLRILPGAVQGRYGEIQADTISLAISAGADRQYGDFSLTLRNLDTDMQYLLTLLKDDSPWEKAALLGDSTHVLNYINQKPGSVSLKLVEDRNKNGQWDPVDYPARQQPERIWIKSLESIRANWEVKAEVEVNFE